MTETDNITITIKKDVAQDVAELINTCMFKGMLDAETWNKMSELRQQLLFTPTDIRF